MRDQVAKPSNIFPINSGLLNKFKGGSFCNFGEREQKKTKNRNPNIFLLPDPKAAASPPHPPTPPFWIFFSSPSAANRPLPLILSFLHPNTPLTDPDTPKPKPVLPLTAGQSFFPSWPHQDPPVEFFSSHLLHPKAKREAPPPGIWVFFLLQPTKTFPSDTNRRATAHGLSLPRPKPKKQNHRPQLSHTPDRNRSSSLTDPATPSFSSVGHKPAVAFTATVKGRLQHLSPSATAPAPTPPDLPRGVKTGQPSPLHHSSTASRQQHTRGRSPLASPPPEAEKKAKPRRSRGATEKKRKRSRSETGRKEK